MAMKRPLAPGEWSEMPWHLIVWLSNLSKWLQSHSETRWTPQGSSFCPSPAGHVVIIPTLCPDCPYELRCPVTLHTSSFYLQTLPTATLLNSACSPSSCILDGDSRVKSSKLVSATQERHQPGPYKTPVQNIHTGEPLNPLLWSAAATRLSKRRVPTLARPEGSLILLDPLTSCLFDGNCCSRSVAIFPCLATGSFTVWPLRSPRSSHSRYLSPSKDNSFQRNTTYKLITLITRI